MRGNMNYDRGLGIRESVLLVLGVALSSLVGVIVGIAASMSGGAQVIGVDFLMYILVSAVVCSVIWIGFMIYTRGATFIILLSILALMLLNLALPPVKYAPIAYGVIGASIVTIFVYAAVLRYS